MPQRHHPETMGVTPRLGPAADGSATLTGTRRQRRAGPRGRVAAPPLWSLDEREGPSRPWRQASDRPVAQRTGDATSPTLRGKQAIDDQDEDRAENGETQ